MHKGSQFQLKQPGLYAITPTDVSKTDLLKAVEAALRGGARIVQFRDKQNTGGDRLARAVALKQCCQHFHIPLIINDDVELCLRSDADGVHLGRDDARMALARQRLGAKAIIGVSCYNQLDMARRALDDGADYLAFGSCYPSATKPKAVRCDLETLRSVRSLGLPVVAIGGIKVENGAPLIRAGADYLAVISDLFAAPDITARAAEYQRLFQHNTYQQDA